MMRTPLAHMDDSLLRVCTLTFDYGAMQHTTTQELYRLTYLPEGKSVGGQTIEDAVLLLEFVGLVDEGNVNKVGGGVVSLRVSPVPSLVDVAALDRTRLWLVAFPM